MSWRYPCIFSQFLQVMFYCKNKELINWIFISFCWKIVRFKFFLHFLNVCCCRAADTTLYVYGGDVAKMESNFFSYTYGTFQNLYPVDSNYFYVLADSIFDCGDSTARRNETSDDRYATNNGSNDSREELRNVPRDFRDVANNVQKCSGCRNY